MHEIIGRLPESAYPSIGPEATGAGRVYEYAIAKMSISFDTSESLGPNNCAPSNYLL
jgi:Cu/Ag efflux pump CusA